MSNNYKTIINAMARGGAADIPIGLVDNTSGKPFNCRTCRFMGDDGKCKNPHPKLKDYPVKPEWCCNLYQHAGMKTIIK